MQKSILLFFFLLFKTEYPKQSKIRPPEQLKNSASIHFSQTNAMKAQEVLTIPWLSQHLHLLDVFARDSSGTFIKKVRSKFSDSLG